MPRHRKNKTQYKTKCDKCSYVLKVDGERDLWAFTDAKTGKAGALCTKHMPKGARKAYTK